MPTRKSEAAGQFVVGVLAVLAADSQRVSVVVLRAMRMVLPLGCAVCSVQFGPQEPPSGAVLLDASVVRLLYRLPKLISVGLTAEYMLSA